MTATPEIYSTVHKYEFKEFTQEWGFHHTTSSPKYPQSNSATERALQTAKRILKKATLDHKDQFEGLLKYRNTPFQDIGASPVQLLMSRPTCMIVPAHRCLLLPQAVDPEQVVLKLSQNASKRNYDKQRKYLPPIEVGDQVRIRPNRERKGRKAEVFPSKYLLEDEQGHIYR